MYLRVDFPSGRCYAAQASDPSWPEWPPHPSRLYSALVASVYRNSDGMTDQKRAVLKWMEALPPPNIAVPRANLTQAPTSYVPPGDSVGSKGKASEKAYEHGVHRWRQPRQFPSVIILDEPVLYYGWDADPDATFLGTLDRIATGVTHLGTSHSMAVVSAHSGEMPKIPLFVPYPNGTDFLRATAKGRLEELDIVYKQTLGVRRPASACEPVVAYRRKRGASTTGKATAFELIPLRVTGTMHGADTAAYLGRALRRAVMSVLGDDAPGAVHGHSGSVHVGWLPLPDVGHTYAKGRIIGVGVALPRQMDTESRQQVLAGVNRIRELRLPDGRVAELSPPVPGEQVPVALKPQTWIRSSQTWSTVTPVVLDRPPKRLAEQRVRKAFSQSLVFAGYPEPSEIEISTFSRFQGAPPAFRVPADKPRYHATVHFKEAISGPVIAGRLRYFGVGLFRPLLMSTGDVA